MVTRALNRSTRPGAFRRPLVGHMCGYDLQVAHKSPVATEALKRIAAPDAIKKEIRGRPPDERREVRKLRSRPLLESLKQWFEEILGKLSRKSDTSIAVWSGPVYGAMPSWPVAE